MALNLPVVLVAISVIWLAIDYLAADYFMELMQQYRISPTEIHRVFLDSVHQYLLLATVVALLLAAVLSYLLTRGLLHPLTDIANTIAHLSGGKLDSRIRSERNDEFGDLATAFNRMADRLQEIEGLRRNMVIDVAHELRTPLTNVRGYIEALQDDVVTADEHTLGILEQEVLRLVSLVEGLLELARAEATCLNLAIRPVSVHRLLDSAMTRLRSEVTETGRALNVDIHESLPEKITRADPDSVFTVLRNLVANALRYAAPGTAVCIRAAPLARHVSISVQNQGSPIATKDLPRVFERFYRADRSRSRDEGGAGIGLAIVKTLVEAQGGEVDICSTAEAGTTVSFTLPIFTESLSEHDPVLTESR